MRSFLAAPLLVGPRVAGSLNLYSTRADGFTFDEIAFVTVVAALAAAHLRTFGAHRDPVKQTSLLQDRVHHRAAIRRTRGMIMAVDEVAADQAFASLRARSLRTGVAVAATAAQMVAVAADPDPRTA